LPVVKQAVHVVAEVVQLAQLDEHGWQVEPEM